MSRILITDYCTLYSCLKYYKYYQTYYYILIENACSGRCSYIESLVTDFYQIYQ